MKFITLDGVLHDFSRPTVMGILNVTPDSFHDGGRYVGSDAMAERITHIVEQGASIIDIGAYSTRPGGGEVSLKDEIERVLPAAKLARELYPSLPVSIDTFRVAVAQTVCDAIGPVIVNDISGGQFDTGMISWVGQHHLPYICMHLKGTPLTMHQHANYHDIILDIISFFARKLVELREAGIRDVMCDPGFGFSKTPEQNFELLDGLDSLAILDCPILVGLSRKSMIWKTLGTDHNGALNGTTALNVVALQKGASILRVHDVREAVETIALLQKTKTLPAYSEAFTL